MEAMAVFVDSNSEGGLGQERTRVRASPRHDDSKRDGNGKGNGKGDVICEGEGEGEGEGKGDGDGVLAACCCYSAATAPLPRCSPATPTPIAHPVTATRMGVAAAGERRSSRVGVGVGVVGVGGGWWVVDLCVYYFTVSAIPDTKILCRGQNMSAPTRREKYFEWMKRSPSNIMHCFFVRQLIEAFITE